MNTASPHRSPTTRALSSTQLLSPTRRGARLARLLALAALHTWQVPASVIERAELIVAELAANAALHGHVDGRNFRLTLTYETDDANDAAATPTALLRIAVTDARGDRLPAPGPEPASPTAESGRGLLLVAALADRWGVAPYPPSGKTVWAECTGAHSGTTTEAGTRTTSTARATDGPSASV
ncbi:ATP-binding protein [Streptomyces sp. MJP52]|uniref:ATP-binding protein n=1 Tax=Streptomyces sp. MJP52 TaxID=2940555 RepID=UPI0024741F59|nr:ATP-binding protein [Streptomyces sp. MJP52]MDH6227837.1 anti-sigma regulatory factor (Ser/Thr protein kinase) [Streptomyces sp. MJP52]